MFEPIVGGK